MKTLHLSIITIVLLSMISAIVPYASAHGVCTGLQPRFGRLDDIAFSKQSVQTGDTITITGNIVSLVQRDLQGQLSIHSSPSVLGRWETISTEPNGSTIYIPQNSRISFSVTVKALQPGTYTLSPIIYLPEISGPAFVSILDGCNTEPVVTVKGDPICAQELAAILKTEDGSPACVRYTTANALIARGWAKQIVSDMKSSEPTVIIPVNSSLMSNGFTFTPSVVKTVIGTNNTVRWINMDSVTNDITSNAGFFTSGAIESGYAWTHTFDKTGTFGYHSDIHPWLKGTVIVTTSPMANLKNDTGVVTLKNQTYYFTTLNDTLSSYHGVAVIPFTFHGIDFTLFPSVFSVGPPGNSTFSCGNTNFSSEVKFTDGTHEKLDAHIPGQPCSENYTETVLSNHQNQQAGVQVYQGKIRLLASVPQTSENTTLPASFEPCASHIPHQTIFGGYAGELSCPAIPYYMTSKIVNYSGFSGVYHTISDSSVVGQSTYTNPEQEEIDKDGNNRMDANLVLEPGHNGTITYQITLYIGRCVANCLPGLKYPTLINQTNMGEFIHHQGNEILHSHDGLEVTYEPQSESLQDNQTVTLKATVTASKDVPRGTYWVILAPGNCAGGPLVLLTVSECEK